MTNKETITKELLKRYNGKVTSQAIVDYFRATGKRGIEKRRIAEIRVAMGYPKLSRGQPSPGTMTSIPVPEKPKNKSKKVVRHTKAVENPLDIIAASVGKACKQLHLSSVIFKMDGETIKYVATQLIEGEVSE